MHIKHRFRGFIPVVIDVETAGFNADTDALLEVALTAIQYNPSKKTFYPGDIQHHHIEPFEGAHLNPEALAFTGIQPDHPFRFAQSEHTVLTSINQYIQDVRRQTGCTKAIMVAHNAHFDQSFINAAYKRTELRNPFHSFTAMDTATLSALAFGETVLAKAMYKARIPFDPNEAHSALYDTQKTAELFCVIMNHYQKIR